MASCPHPRWPGQEWRPESTRGAQLGVQATLETPPLSLGGFGPCVAGSIVGGVQMAVLAAHPGRGLRERVIQLVFLGDV